MMTIFKRWLRTSLLLSSCGLLLAGCGEMTAPARLEAAADSRWVVDVAASRIGFSSSFAGSPVRGGFKRWQANIAFDPARPERSTVDVEIELGSVATGTDEMDASLLGPDWFQVAVAPVAHFRSTAFRHVAGEWYEVTGNLSLRGVTQAVGFPVRIMLDGDHASANGSFTINRSLFGVGQGQWRDGGSVPLEVQVAIDIRASRASAARQGAPHGAAAHDVPAASTAEAPVDDYHPTPAFPGQTRASAPAAPSRYKVTVLASGLERPWALAFLPDGCVLITERPGRMRILRTDGTLSTPLAGVPAVKAIAAEGLHDVVLDPDFVRNRRLYFSYFAPLEHDKPPVLQDWIAWLSLPAGQHEKQPFGRERVASAELSADGTRLENVRVISEGGNRRLVFAPDGALFIAAAPPAGGGIPVDMEPQLTGNSYGKVLRIRPDGTIPPDNPFVGKPGIMPSIYALGLRDMEGAAIDPRTGKLWTLEHGPRGGDEINIVEPGRNYGFPVISYGREYSGALINNGKTAAPGFEQPRYFWTPSIAPSGMAFYTGSLFPEWRGSLFVGALGGKRLIRLALDGDRVLTEEALLADRGKRIRDVRTGPDGALYVLTDDQNGELLRLTPDP